MIKINKKGFTLTEVLVVIVIISLIVVIAIPSIIAISKRINERLLESKKDMILIEAELYAQDNPQIFSADEIIIKVGTLVDLGYIKNDVEQNDTNCSDSYGCVTNPVDKTSLNGADILIKKASDTIIVIWEGTLGSSTSRELVNLVKTELNCGTITENSPCLYVGTNPDNYLYYSGVMWRILGVYKIDNKEVVKMITDDNISWEEETS